MTHEDILNTLLYNACPMKDKDNDGWKDYYIELHCAEFIVTARYLGNVKFEVSAIQSA